MKLVIVLVMALAACGGAKKQAAKSPAPGSGDSTLEGSATKAGDAKGGGESTPAPDGADPCQGGEKP